MNNVCILCGGEGWRRLTAQEIEKLAEWEKKYAIGGHLTKRCECGAEEPEDDEEIEETT